ncbi:MAG: hypothetical protein ACYCY6_02665 [Minisyncoccota bacterium]
MPPKPPKKPEPKKDLFVEFGFIIIVLIFLWVLWSAIVAYVSSLASFSEVWQTIVDWFLNYLWPILMIISLVVTVVAILGIARHFKKLKNLNKEEEEIYGSSSVVEAEEPVQNKNERWEHAVAHLNSANASDWRLAIIEADVMLDELLRAKGYHGDSIGEMLKGVDKSDILTLDSAWEAHKIRNEIVHSGSGYELNERDAKRAMSHYEAVFREFRVI